jgi:transcriptional regulator with XRE-family HTH domain
MATVTKLPTKTDRVISATVKALYNGRGLTANQVARAIGVSHGTMSNRLNCLTSWTAAEVQALADFFNVAVVDLYEGMGGMFPGPLDDAPNGVKLPRRDSNTQPAGCVDQWLRLVQTGDRMVA